MSKMPKELLSPRSRFSLKLPPLPDEPPQPLLTGGDQGGRTPRVAISMEGLYLPPMEEHPALTPEQPPYAPLYKGHLYKTQLGSSLPDLSARLQRQRTRLPRQFEKFSFQVRTDAPLQGAARSRMGYLPVLTPRTPVIVKCRAAQEAGAPPGAADDTSRSGAGSEAPPHLLEIHADVLDQTFVQHAKPGARPPWRTDCFCPRCGFEREQWVERNRKPFRPFSRQRELSFMSFSQPIGREKLSASSSIDFQHNQQKVALNTNNNAVPNDTPEGSVTFRAASKRVRIDEGEGLSKGISEGTVERKAQSNGKDSCSRSHADRNIIESASA